MADQEIVLQPIVTTSTKTNAARKKKTAAQQGTTDSSSLSTVATGPSQQPQPSHARVLRIIDIIDTNAAGASSFSGHADGYRPRTPTKEKSTIRASADSDKEKDVTEPTNQGDTTPRRTRPKAKVAATPEATAEAASTELTRKRADVGSPTPSKIPKREAATPRQDAAPASKKQIDTTALAPPPPKMDKRDEGDAMSETERTVVAEGEPRMEFTDSRREKVGYDTQSSNNGKQKPTDTQDDLLGLPLPQFHGAMPDELSETTANASEKDVKSPGWEGSKFPGWDEYPPLSVEENDRESRARGHISYRAYGVRFAPFNIPFKRRLQTLAVLMHSLSIAGTVSIFFFLCAIPLTWPLLVPYLLHILLSSAATDGRLRFRSERFRRLPIWGFFADYYPARLHKTHDLPPTRKYIFGYHPHGIISHGAFAAFATEALGFTEKFPGIQNSLLTLDSNFRIPLYREYILSLGIMSVSKDSITNILSQGGRNGEGMGRAVTIVVGGARESLEAQPGTLHLVLGERKGFIKVAVRTGADLVPVLAFGENDLYDQVSPKTHPSLRRLQMYALRTLKFTLPFLHGRGIFNYDVGLMPYRRPLNIVVGRPIKVKQARNDAEVDMQEVDRLHGEYVRELKKMWDRYKDDFAPDREEEMVIMN